MASLKHLVSFFAFFSLINLLVAQEVNCEQKCWHQFWWWLRWVPAEGWSDGGRICPRFLNSKFSLSHSLNFRKSCSQLNFQMKANILRLPVLNKMGNCIVCLFIWNWFSESVSVSIIFFCFQGSPECYFVSQAETRLIRQKVKRKKRPSYVGAGGGGKHDQASTNEVDSS